MIAQENKYTNISGSFPDALLIDASGAGLTDGSEYAALQLNDNWDPFQQAIMDYADGGTNAPTGSVGVPNGVADAKGVNQVIQSIQHAHGIGPGIYVQWGKNVDPSVSGDRVLLLAEQGVLIANYPDLDREVWIGGNTAAQIAAEAAGEKFYRSSDSGGTTGNAAGPYLQLPAANPTFRKQYSEASGDFAVTGTNSWSTVSAVAVPYQTAGGVWRLIFNFAGTVSPSQTTVLTVSGVVFKAGLNQAVEQSQSVSIGFNKVHSHTIGGTATISVGWSVTGMTNFQCSGDVELNSIPTMADDFEFPWGITY